MTRYEERLCGDRQTGSVPNGSLLAAFEGPACHSLEFARVVPEPARSSHADASRNLNPRRSRKSRRGKEQQTHLHSSSFASLGLHQRRPPDDNLPHRPLSFTSIANCLWPSPNATHLSNLLVLQQKYPATEKQSPQRRRCEHYLELLPASFSESDVCLSNPCLVGSPSAMDRIPLHRRASWGKNQQSYDAYMRNDLAKIRSPTSSQDYGIGNFSYDDKHLSEWSMPDTIKQQHLPTQIVEKTDDWRTSGAALDTALERIEHLHAEAMLRGWPDKKHAHLARPHWPSPTGPGAQSPSAGPVSPTASVADSLERADFTLPFSHPVRFGAPTRPPMGMESPPFTPVNAPTTPSMSAEGTAATLPDLAKLNTQLSLANNTGAMSPVTAGTLTPSPPGSATAPLFDEHAWETYINQCKNEHNDLRWNALSRFKGTARDLDKLTVEYAHTSEYAEVLKVFKLWWDGQRPKMKLYEDKVKSLELPTEDQAKRERLAKGLAV